jgi:uncharacterized protein YggE
MTRFCTLSALAIGILFAAGSHVAMAQAPESPLGYIGGAGVAVIKRQPELMRMRLELTATGKDLKDALSKLKARREAALKVCSDLGTAADSLVVGSPRIAPDSPQRQQMMMMMRQRARNGGKPAKKSEAAPPVNVAATLTAEWPLKGTDPEELLVASQTLRDKIKSDLGKSTPKEELSPEDEEVQEEAAAETMNYNNGNGPKPGEPTFVFVAKVSKADYVKAAAKAFAMAKAHAQRLADAAGAPLGELRNMNGDDRQAMAMMNYQQQRYFNGMQEDDSTETETSSDEAIGPNPAEVRLNVTVTASFALGK